MSIGRLGGDYLQGETVLCFEPDPSKARLLYYAKVIEVLPSIERHGKPVYLVHFQGWNSNWDRIVPEELVLQDCEENIRLMKTLLSMARTTKKNSVRKRRIEHILRKVFKRKPHSRSGESSGSDAEKPFLLQWRRRKIFSKKVLNEPNDGDASEADKDKVYQSRSRSQSETSGASKTRKIPEESCESSESEEEVELSSPLQVDVDLPQNLKKILEDDLVAVKYNSQLLQLPSSYCVVSLLEDYVRYYARQSVIVCPPSEKKVNKLVATVPTEHRLLVCKQWVDSLRILFDFNLETLLLYEEEEQQFHEMMSKTVRAITSPPPSPNHSKKPRSLVSEPEAAKDEPTTNGAIHVEVQAPQRKKRGPKHKRRRRGATVAEGVGVGEVVTEPRRTRRSLWFEPDRENGPEAAAQDGGREEGEHVMNPLDPADLSHPCEYLLPVRRRRGLHERSSPKNKQNTHSPPSDKTSVSPPRKMSKSEARFGSHKSRRSSKKPANCPRHPPKTAEVMESTRHPPKTTEVAESARHPPKTSEVAESRLILEMQNSLALYDSDADSEVTFKKIPLQALKEEVAYNGGSAAGRGSALMNWVTPVKQEVIVDLSDWHLIPEHHYQHIPPMPSLVYGPHHLLRLLVRLPEILPKLTVAERLHAPIAAHLDYFIEYLSEHSDALFVPSAYIDT